MIKAITSKFYQKLTGVIITWDLIAQKPCKAKIKLQKLKNETQSGLFEFCKAHKLPPKNIRKFSRFLENGFSTFGIYEDSEMIGYIWWVEADLPKPKQHPSQVIGKIDLQPSEIYIFDVFIAKKFRGGGKATGALALVGDELKKAGKKKAYAIVDEENQPARKLYAGQGWQDAWQVDSVITLKKLHFSEGRIFIKNNAKQKPHNYDYRLVFPTPH